MYLVKFCTCIMSFKSNCFYVLCLIAHISVNFACTNLTFCIQSSTTFGMFFYILFSKLFLGQSWVPWLSPFQNRFIATAQRSPMQCQVAQLVICILVGYEPSWMELYFGCCVNKKEIALTSCPICMNRVGIDLIKLIKSLI